MAAEACQVHLLLTYNASQLKYVTKGNLLPQKGFKCLQFTISLVMIHISITIIC